MWRPPEDGVAVPGSGQPVRRDGAGAVRDRAGVHGHVEQVCGRGPRHSRKAFARSDFRRRGGGPSSSHVVRPARVVRGGDGAGPPLAIMGSRTGRGPRSQRRSVLGGLRHRCVRPRGRRFVACGTRTTVRESACGRSYGRRVRRCRPGRELHRRVPATGRGGLQRRQHRAVRSARGPRAGGGRADSHRRSMRMAGHQPCLSLRAARSGPRRVRILRVGFRVRFATANFGVQPHRRCRRQAGETGRQLLAQACEAARRIRQERAFARRARLRAAPGGRSTAGAHRRGPAGVARHRVEAGDHSVVAPPWFRAASDQ